MSVPASATLASTVLLPMDNDTISLNFVQRLQQINGSNLKQRERELLADAIKAAEALSDYRQSLSNQEAQEIGILCSLLEAIERFLDVKAGRSCFRLFCCRLRRLFSRGCNDNPGTTTDGYRMRLLCFLEQLNNSRGGLSEAEATDVIPAQGSQEDTTPGPTPRISQSTPSAALGLQYSSSPQASPGLPAPQHPYTYPHLYQYPYPPSPYSPYPYLYPPPMSDPSSQSPPTITINISNIGNDNRTTTATRNR